MTGARCTDRPEGEKTSRRLDRFEKWLAFQKSQLMLKTTASFLISAGLVSITAACAKPSAGDVGVTTPLGTRSLLPTTSTVTRPEPFTMVNLRDFQGNGGPDISLRIPVRYLKLGDGKGPFRTAGPVVFYLTYPDMRGGNERDNSNIPYCTGECRGLTQVSLYNTSNGIDDIQSRLMLYVSDKKTYYLRKSGNFSSEFEEYDVMWKIFPFKIWHGISESQQHGAKERAGALHSPNDTTVPPPGYVSQKTFDAYQVGPWPFTHIFVFRSAAGKIDIVECPDYNTNNNGQLCQYASKSKIIDSLKYRVDFKYQNMKNFPKFISSLNNIIDGFTKK